MLTIEEIINTFDKNDKVVNFSIKVRSSIGPDGAKQIKEHSDWKRLEKFAINNNDIQNEGVRWLAQCDWKNLDSINLRKNSITAAGAFNLIQADWQNLTRIDLGSNKIGGEGVGHLTKCKWPKLKSLILENNHIQVLGAKFLAKSDWPNLERIDINYNLIGNKGMIHLSKANWPKLQFANFCYNDLDGEAMYYLAEANWPDLKVLMLNRNNIGLVKERLSDLGSFYLTQLKTRVLNEIEIFGNSLSFPAVKMIITSNVVTLGSTVLLRNNQFDENQANKELSAIIEEKQIKLPYTLN